LIDFYCDKHPRIWSHYFKRTTFTIQEIGLMNYLDLFKHQIVDTFVDMNGGS